MTFIAIFPDGKTIYTIHEVQDYDGQGQNSGAVSRWLKGRNVFGKPEMNKMEVVYNSMGFFRLQTSYSNLPKQVGILSSCIQIVFQNIENSSIREHVKIGLKTANFSQIS